MGVLCILTVLGSLGFAVWGFLDSKKVVVYISLAICLVFSMAWGLNKIERVTSTPVEYGITQLEDKEDFYIIKDPEKTRIVAREKVFFAISDEEKIIAERSWGTIERLTVYISQEKLIDFLNQ